MDKGKRQLLNRLYETHKQELYYLCKASLMREKEAVSAATWVFETAFQDVLAGRLSSGDKFIASCKKRAADYCKQQLVKRDPKALRTPGAKNFYIRDFNNTDIPADADPIDTLLSVLPQPQNFLFVLSHIGHLSEAEIAAFTGMKEETVRIALNAEERNLSLANDHIRSIGRNTQLPAGGSLAAAVEKSCQACGVPAALDEKIGEFINARLLPEEQRAKKKMLTLLGSIAAGVIAVAVIVLVVGKISNSRKAEDMEDSEMLWDSDEYNDGTENVEVAEMTDYALITIDGYGIITVALDAGAAPETVNNFINLAESGFYDGLTFHRIMDGFMMQGGDPEGNGSGGSENTITGEFSANGFENNISHTRGTISMARANDYNSASSQFFIVQEDSTFLDGQYAAFGRVTDGMDIVDQICADAKPVDDNGTIPAEEQPVIASITIHRQ